MPTRLELDDGFDEAPEDVSRPQEEALPREEAQDKDLGYNADGKSLCLRAKYFCSMGSKQVPPAVCCGLHLRCASQKRSQYCKRLKQKREEADALMMQSELDVHTVESLMACPIS